MNDQTFDDLARWIAAARASRVSRRSVLRSLGVGAPVLALAARGAGRHVPAAKAQATPAAGPQPGIRPPAGPSVAQKAFDLVGDPEAIFAFVAREVQYDPYPGALRGAKGALWGLAGNSVDQALLLAALLNESLVATRFAVGPLDEAAAARLLGAAMVERTKAVAQAAAVNALLTPGQGAPPPSSLTPEQRRLVEALPQRAAALFETGAAQLADGVGLLRTALAGAGVAIPAPVSALPERERSRHVWVQYAAGPEWRDLDPSMPGAEMGKAYATAAQTLDALPDDLFHTMAFRVVAEKVRGGQAETADLLNHEARSADLVGRPLSLLHVKPDALTALGQTVTGALDGTIQYIPHLALGSDDAVVGSGRVTLGVGPGLIDVLGGAGGNDGDTIAEWLEITVVSPDAPPRKIRRVVFDWLSAEQRAAGDADLSALAPATLAEFDGGRLFLPLEAIWSIVTAAGPVPLSSLQQDRAIDDFEADLAYVGLSYHNARDNLALHIAADSGSRFFLDAPNLTAFAITPLAISADVAIDLLHQSIGVVPFTGAAPAAGAGLDARVVAGVLSHVTERLLMEGDTGGLVHGPAISAIGVGRIFEEAKRAGIPTRTLPPGSSAPRDLAVSVRARTAIDAALSAGHLVVVPGAAVEMNGDKLVGWWQIDPKTGVTFDLMETGRGAAGAEYALTLQTIARNAIYYFSRLGFCAYTVFTLAALIGFGASYGAAVASGGAGMDPATAMGSAILGGGTVGTVGTMALVC